MKILMWGRFDLNDVGGGDKVQIDNTAAELRKLGIEVDISTTIDTDLSEYDLVHLFQLDWIPETYFYAKKAKKYNKPLVLSPIHHSVKEVKRFDDEYAFGLRKISKILFREQHSRDTFKNVYRSLHNKKKIWPTFASIFVGLKNMHIETLKMADRVLVQTELEAFDLKDTYGVDVKWTKVPNGVGRIFSSEQEYENTLGVEDYILCVGRIEARKNQLSIIEAVGEVIREQDTDLHLIFVGKKSGHHGEYVKLFDDQVAKNNWITYVPYTPWEEMPGIYQHAKVCVSASWFETSGLTSLEALFMGTNVVAAGDRAREFLGNLASYCDPGDVTSIAKAIEVEYSKERPRISDEMKKEFTWVNAAQKTLKVYEDLLK